MGGVKIISNDNLEITADKSYYDKKKSSNFLIADNEIFNLRYNIKFKNDFVNKRITSIFNSSSLNLKVENDLDYKKYLNMIYNNTSYI